MRTLLLPMLMLLVLPAAPAAADLTDLQNAIGLYTDIPGDLSDVSRLTAYEGDPGTFTVYAVLSNPYNENTGAPISLVGGFEFRLELPSNIILLDATLPPSSVNFMNPPNFYVGTSVSVSGDVAPLLTMTLGEFSGSGGRIQLAPVSNYPSIPGSLAVADADDEYSLSAAVPSSGRLDAPVFCVFCRQYEEESTWGGIKTLFR